MSDDVERHDVIQLSPDFKWGPLLCVVDEVHSWGVSCYALAPLRGGSPSEPWAAVPLRIDHGEYERVGTAHWAFAREGETDDG